MPDGSEPDCSKPDPTKPDWTKYVRQNARLSNLRPFSCSTLSRLDIICIVVYMYERATNYFPGISGPHAFPDCGGAFGW